MLGATTVWAILQRPAIIEEARQAGISAGLAAVNPMGEMVIRSLTLDSATTSMTNPLKVRIVYDKIEGCEGVYQHFAYTTDRNRYLLQPLGDLEADPPGNAKVTAIDVYPQTSQSEALIPGQYWYALKVRVRCPNKSEQVVSSKDHLPFTVTR